jgi:hypothetical protein
MYYFYIWHNHVGRTCFGVTGNPFTRLKKYEGHAGVEVSFDVLFEGPESHVRDLEVNVKAEFWDHLFQSGKSEKYEWINNTVSTEQVINWVQWEIDNNYPTLKICKS